MEVVQKGVERAVAHGLETAVAQGLEKAVADGQTWISTMSEAAGDKLTKRGIALPDTQTQLDVVSVTYLDLVDQCLVAGLPTSALQTIAMEYLFKHNDASDRYKNVFADVTFKRLLSQTAGSTRKTWEDWKDVWLDSSTTQRTKATEYDTLCKRTNKYNGQPEYDVSGVEVYEWWTAWKAGGTASPFLDKELLVHTTAFQRARRWMTHTMTRFKGANADNFKKKVNRLIRTREAENDAKQRLPRLYNATFKGPAGTGKTTFAEIYARVLFKIGAVAFEKTQLVTVNDLDRPGQSADLCSTLFETNRGGTVLIDEAYLLASAKYAALYNAIFTTMPGSAPATPDLVTNFVFMGYEKEMNDLIAQNEGFDRRIKQRFTLDAVKIPTLVAMMVSKIDGYPELAAELDLDSDPFKKILKNGFEKIPPSRLQQYNAAAVSAVFACIWDAAAACAEDQDEEKGECGELKLTEEAVSQGFSEFVKSLGCGERCLVYDEGGDAFEDTQELPDGVVYVGTLTYDKWVTQELFQGFENTERIQERLKALHKCVVRDHRRRQNKEPALLSPFFHASFVGPPGTGKTTIAAKWVEGIQKLALVEHAKYTKKPLTTKDLIKDVLGASSVATEKIMAAYRGGVVIIDEAYNLAPVTSGSGDTFRKEVRDVLMDTMPGGRTTGQQKGDYTTIVLLGYEKEMKVLFDSNPGWDRRLGKNQFTLEPFTESALLNIFSTKYLALFHTKAERKVKAAFTTGCQEHLVYIQKNQNASIAEALLDAAILAMGSADTLNEKHIAAGWQELNKTMFKSETASVTDYFVDY